MSLPFDGSESTRNTTTTVIRVVSLSIAFYDYLLTLPAEWRFYRSQRSWRLSPGCILFIAIRYLSIAVICVSNIGYFGNFFTAQFCRHWFLAAPVLKDRVPLLQDRLYLARACVVSMLFVMQAMVSQLILGIRTINISRRSTWVTWTIAIAFGTVTIAEWFVNMWNRVPVQGRIGNCTAGNKPPILTVWLFYVCAMVYDMLTLAISTGYLISFGSNPGSMARLVKIMLTDGLVYFVALTGVNILNLILYRSTDEAVQSAGVSLGYALTWIMSQRILIHLRDAAAAHNRTATTQIVLSRRLQSALSVSQAMRAQFETKSRDHLSSAFDIDWSLASERPDRSALSLPTPASRGGATAKKRRARGGVRVVERSTGATTAERDVERGVGAERRERPGEDEHEYQHQHQHEGEEEEEFELDVEVQIEETVTVEYDAEVHERESYRTPRVRWNAADKSSTGDGEGAAGT